MKVSIVIPVYNEAAQLAVCLEAIAAQTVAPAEVLVVDNNSTDNSRVVAESYSFVTLLSEHRQGIVHARNRGFDAAKGDIIARIDADTVLPANWVAYIRNFYKQSVHQQVAFSGGASFYNVRWPKLISWLYNRLVFDFNRLLVGHVSLWGSNMALTRSQWQAVRRHICRQTDIHEDLDLAIHLRQAGYAIFYDSQLPVGAELRPVRTNRQELWRYLQWWPNTLRRHRRASWVVCWLFGCLALYVTAPLLNLVEYLAQRFSRRATKALLGTERI